MSSMYGPGDFTPGVNPQRSVTERSDTRGQLQTDLARSQVSRLFSIDEKVGQLPRVMDGLVRSTTALQQETKRVADNISVLASQVVLATNRNTETLTEVRDALRATRGEDFARAVRDVAEDRGEQARGGMRGVPRTPEKVRQQEPGEAGERLLRGESEAVQTNALEEFRRARAQPMTEIRKRAFGRMAQGLSGMIPPEEEAGLTDTMGWAMTLRNVLGTTAQRGAGAGLASALPAGLARFAGPVGLAVGAGAAGLEFAERQRAANLGYQQALGGSNVEGFGQRIREQMFQFTQMGTMGGGQAEQLFRGVTDLGLEGGRRDRALDFATDAYRRFGMTIDESMTLITEATRRGEESFGGLTESLENVTEVAAEADVNAQQARQAFVRSYQSLAPEVGAMAAQGLAESLTTTVTSLGPTFQNVDLSGMVSESMLRQGLARAQQTGAVAPGTRYGEYLGAMSTQEGQQTQLQMAQDIAMERVGRVMGGERGIAQTGQLMREAFGTGDLSAIGEMVNTGMAGGQLQALSSRMLQAGVMPEPGVAVDILASAGITGVEPAQAPALAALLQAGAISPARDVAERLGELESEEFDVGSFAAEGGEVGEAAYGGLAGSQGPGTPTETETTDIAIASIMEEIEEDAGVTLEGEARSAAEAYARQAVERGRRDPVYEKVLAQEAQRIAGGAEAAKFRVMAGGKERYVSLEEAAGLTDQFQTGAATYATGSRTGTTVGEQFGLPADFFEGDVESMSDEDLAEVGISREQFEAEQERRSAEGREGETGRVTLVPHPALARGIRILTEGNVDVGESEFYGNPPQPDAPYRSHGQSGY